MKRLPFLAALLIAAAPGGSDGDPAAYRLRLTVRPAHGGGVQRIDLPAPVLAAAQRADLADLRVFDARGRAMPIARAPVSVRPARRDTFPALPILGPADGLKVTGVSLKLDDRGRAQLAQVDGTPLDAASGPVLLGALFDARAVTGSARSLTLDTDIPTAQPVTFTVAASRDLKTWRPLGDQTLYRRSADRVPATIALGDAGLDRDYLRVTWSAGTRLLSPVTVRSATLVTRPTGAAAATSIDATLPALADPRTIDLAMPFATPIATIRIVPGGDDTIVPVRILGRADREQPWTLLGTGTARRDDADDIPLSGATVATLRIEADARTGGFTAPPTIRFGFASQSIAFLAAGEAPFTLAVGQAAASGVYLPLASLRGDDPAPLPAATIAAARVAALPLVLAEPGNRQQVVLWAILLAATALLGMMAWLLWRRDSHTPSSRT